MFMRVSDIAGESKAEGHEDWIDLQSLSSGLSRLVQGSNRRDVFHEDVGISKFIDKSSPKLIEALTKGIVLEEVVIEDNRMLSEDLWSQYEVRMQNALVSDYHIQGQSEEILPFESFSFYYDKIDWIHRLCNGDGIFQERVEVFWDLILGVGGSSSNSGDNEPPAVDPVANQSVDPATSNQVDLIIGDMETGEEDLVVTSHPELIGNLTVTGTNRQLSYSTTALRSGFASISVEVFDGMDTQSISIPILIGTEMTPFEGCLAAYFGEEELDNPKLTSPILDPDKDGILTVIEYLLGTNPAEFNRSSEAMKVAFDSDVGECALTLDFKKRLDDPNVQGYIWVSQNMKDWERMDSSNPMYEETGQQGQNPLFEETTATIAFPDVCKEPIFIRFQVQDVF